MKVTEANGHIILEEVRDFDIEHILECGQCFHFKKLSDKEYVLTACQHLLHIQQKNSTVYFYNTSEVVFQNIWKNYFDLKTDYGQIKSWLSEHDAHMPTAIAAGQGIRILNQELFETTISFIISQNKQIPHIKQIVRAISAAYGDFLGQVDGEDYYAFPTVEQLSKATEADLRALKTGFRAPYIVDAVRKFGEGLFDQAILKSLDHESAMTQLMLIKGIGRKVANCVALFALAKREAFPVDVWIARIMDRLYFEGNATNEAIEAYAREHFGKWGGYAQQYLFYYAREMKDKVS